MVYKGEFSFDRKKHPGECEIDKDNNIYLTINESSLNGYKRKIEGIASNENLTIYNCRLVDHDIGYYKYQVDYVVTGINIKYGRVDLNNYIQDFRFTFNPLDEWLGIVTIKNNTNSIEIIYPDDIELYNFNGLKIIIKYYREDDGIVDNSINNLKVKPYICVETNNVLKIENIMEYIQIITRFFAILIGFNDNVNNIMFHKRYKGKVIMESIENKLIINTDFSNRYRSRQGYNTFHLRTYYNELPEKIDTLFTKWFDLYEKYREAIIMYFSPYNTHTIESEFLNITKCLEKVSIQKESKKEKKKKNKQIHNIIQKFYSTHKKELIDDLKKVNFKKKYINNIEEIHEEIANSIIYKYDNRITLSKRIKDLDSEKQLINHLKNNHITSIKANLTIYDYIANTRNYYTHLNDKSSIIKTIYIPGYCRILEKIFVSEILNFIIDDKKYISDKLKCDNYLTIYDRIDY